MTKSSNSNLRNVDFTGKFRTIAVLALLQLLLSSALTPTVLRADVPTGDEDSAKAYYRVLAKMLGFSTPDQIFQTTLNDVANYLGYNGITGTDLQNVPSGALMNLDQLLTASGAPPVDLQHPDVVIASQGPIPFRPDDILAIRFFAPKIMNIKDPEAIRKLGWRKLVRLRARPGSQAQTHHISSGIILFNFFTQPGAAPFGATNESVNTQVMLITETSRVPAPNSSGPPTLYWLDYGPLSQGGILSFALNASFDANELQSSTGGTRSYFVPDGCVACHGNNSQRSMVNYLDTDHWFDRLDNDFVAVKAAGLPLLFDAQTNDTNSLAYKVTFDIIRRFNAEADEQVRKAQPKHDESLAAEKWLEIHSSSDQHILPIDRVIGPDPQWSVTNSTDVAALSSLNQYCFRCHGTVKFSVFDKQKLLDPQLRPIAAMAVSTNAPIGIRMPPDRDLPEDVRAQILRFLAP